MRVGSLFTGVGGFDLGFERAGMEIAWQSEIDPACNWVLSHHWPDVANLGEIGRTGISRGRRLWQIGKGQLLTPSSVDLLCGGFPCQDVSFAGSRGGLKSERSGLFFEFLRIAHELQPKWVVIENVPGLLSSNQGQDFYTILESLAQVGYADVSWRILDSLGFGVPQRRRRLFIVGCFGAGTRSRQVLLESEGCEWRAPQSTEPEARVATLTADGARTRSADGELTPTHARTLTSSNQRIDFETETFIPTYDRMVQIIVEQSAPIGFHATQDPISLNGAALPLEHRNGQYGQAVAIQARAGGRVRRLTPTECERLQGFPDGWTVPAQNDSARYKCLGNAVTVPVAEWIGNRIMDVEHRETPKLVWVEIPA